MIRAVFHGNAAIAHQAAHRVFSFYGRGRRGGAIFKGSGSRAAGKRTPHQQAGVAVFRARYGAFNHNVADGSRFHHAEEAHIAGALGAGAFRQPHGTCSRAVHRCRAFRCRCGTQRRAINVHAANGVNRNIRGAGIPRPAHKRAAERMLQRANGFPACRRNVHIAGKRYHQPAKIGARVHRRAETQQLLVRPNGVRVHRYRHPVGFHACRVARLGGIRNLHVVVKRSQGGSVRLVAGLCGACHGGSVAHHRRSAIPLVA